MNRDNLTRLADYLDSLPQGYKHFQMDSFFAHKNGFDTSDIPKKPVPTRCGTVACAIGHGPAAGVPVGEHTDWEEYAAANFIPISAEYYWCFAALWAHYDDTPQGAAARIRYLLDGNEVPNKDERWLHPKSEYVTLYERYLQ